MSNQQNISETPEAARPSWNDWARDNPLQVVLVNALTVIVLAAASSFVGVKSAAQSASEKPVTHENFATKQDKDEIWRYLQERAKILEEQMSQMRQNAASKDDIRGLNQLVELSNRTNDEQIRMLQEQNKLLQSLIEASRDR